MCSSRAGWIGFKEGKRRSARIVIFGGQFACAREEDRVGGVGVAEPSGKSEGRVAMLEDVYSGCFGDDLRERLRHRNDGLNDRSEMIEDGLEFGKIIRGGGKEDVIGVEVGGLLEVGGLEIESCERGATVKVTEQHGIKDRGEDLIPFASGVGSVSAIGADTEDISAGDEGLTGDVVC